MKKYTPEQLYERKKKSRYRREKELEEIRKFMGFRITSPKPENTEYEKKRQEKITQFFREYGWFKDFEIEDKRMRIPTEPDEIEIETYYQKNNMIKDENNS